MKLLTFLKKSRPKELERTMAGIKIGASVLQIDGKDKTLATALASSVGLSGEFFVVAQDSQQLESINRAAASAGVLVETKISQFTSLPYENFSMDLVVIKDILGQLKQNDRVLLLQEVHRILKIGARCLVIEPSLRGGLGALFSQQSLDKQYFRNGAKFFLRSEGFRGVRVLTERDGQIFTEATRTEE
tara:strand:+ start:48278 stop:48841 length:564 start_codon:yes stop_codon:yes gene_type:complete